MSTMPNYWDNPTPTPAGADPLADPKVAEAERIYSMFTHLSLLVHIPIFVALVMWLIKRETSPFIDDHGRETVNFQISLVIYFLVGAATAGLCIGIPILIATYVLGLVGMILGAIAAHKGRYFRYPACIRLLH